MRPRIGFKFFRYNRDFVVTMIVTSLVDQNFTMYWLLFAICTLSTLSTLHIVYSLHSFTHYLSLLLTFLLVKSLALSFTVSVSFFLTLSLTISFSHSLTLSFTLSPFLYLSLYSLCLQLLLYYFLKLISRRFNSFWPNGWMGVCWGCVRYKTLKTKSFFKRFHQQKNKISKFFNVPLWFQLMT